VLEAAVLPADLSMPLWPWQAPLVVLTVCVVPSLQCTVMLPAAAGASCAKTGAAISAAASTAIRPNDFM